MLPKSSILTLAEGTVEDKGKLKITNRLNNVVQSTSTSVDC